MRLSKLILYTLKLYYIFNFFNYITKGRLINEYFIGNSCFFVESLRIDRSTYTFINFNSIQPVSIRYNNKLYAVPKKKPSKRRTKIRKNAWMKRFPKNYKRPMMLDMFDITKYTDGTFTKSRTIHQNWLNLPNTSLDGNHIFTKEVRPSW